MALPVGERLVMTSDASLFFVFDRNGDDVGVYSSLGDAEKHLEAIDVRNNEYEAFDAEGRLLRLTVENEAVRITPAENEPGHAAELRDKLEVFLKATKVPDVTPGASLSQLVSAANQFAIKIENPGRLLKRIFGRSK